MPCGGKGERLASLTAGEVPKSLFVVGGKELIRYSTDLLTPETIQRLVFAVGLGGEEIKAWTEQANLPYSIHFSEQVESGILNAITSAADYVEGEGMIACNTDEIRLGLDLAEAVFFHESHDTLVTMVATTTDHLYRHRLLEIQEDNLVLRTRLKPAEFKTRPHSIGLVNTGFLLIDKGAMEYFDPGHNTDWGGIIDPLCEAGQISAYIDWRIQFFNVGTVEEYSEARAYLEEHPSQGQGS